MLKETISTLFRQEFGLDPILVHAPGRINMIGEHTDYNKGLVMPAAIDKGITFGIEEAEGDHCRVYSVDNEEWYEFDLKNIQSLDGGWQNYIIGVAAEILSLGKKLQPFNLIFGGDIPQGAGLSSSAALECGTAVALDALFRLDLQPLQMAYLSQLAEHKYAGVKCGIMDQFASMFGKDDQVILLDCKSMQHQYFPARLPGYDVVLCNSNVAHNLASSEYNIRRSQCEQAVEILQRSGEEVDSLRDVTMDMLSRYSTLLDPVVFKRCKYIIEENDRVRDFGQLLRADDISGMGTILRRAHEGMRTEYEITCVEIDYLVHLADDFDGVAGARMMGGGFGGCTLNLVQHERVEAFLDYIKERYFAKFSINLTPIPIKISDGAKVIS